MVGISSSSLLALPAQAGDTLILKFGNNSSIVIQLNDKKDLETIRKYDINQMLDQLQVQVDSSDQKNFLLTESEEGLKILEDTTIYYSEEEAWTAEEEEESNEPFTRTDVWDNSDDEDDSYQSGKDYKIKFNRKRNFADRNLNFDLGINNWLLDGNKLPNETDEDYSVRNWASIYFAINSIYTTKIAGPLYLDWGLGVSWYNFKFSDDEMRLGIDETTNNIVFAQQTNPDINSIKSKLTVPHLNANFVPNFRFGKNGDGFRIGAGVYGGYRIGGYTKVVFNENGNKQKDKVRDDFNLNTWRYGLRAQLGWKDFDLFVNYDLNTVFSDSQTPKLNAFSFGITI